MEGGESKRTQLSELMAEMSRLQSPIETKLPPVTSRSHASPDAQGSRQSHQLSFRSFDEVDRLAAECDRLRSDLEKYSQRPFDGCLKSQINNQKRVIEGLQSDNRYLRDTIKTMELRLSSGDAYTAAMQQQISELRLDRDKYKQRISTLQDERAAQVNTTETESRISAAPDLSSKIAAVRAEKKSSELRLESEISDLRRKLGSLEKQRKEELEEQETRLRREISILTRQLSEREPRKHLQELKERDIRITSQQSELRTLHEEMAKRETELQDATIASTVMSQNLQRLQEKLEESTDARERLVNEQEELLLKLESYQIQNTSLQAETAQLRDMVEGIKKDLPMIRASLLASFSAEPRSPERLFEDAVAMCEARSYSEAVASLQLCIAKIELNPSAYSADFKSDVNGQLGVALQYSGELNGARAAYMRAIEEDPTAHACFANLALVCFSSGAKFEGEEYLRIAEGLSPANPAYASIRRLHCN